METCDVLIVGGGPGGSSCAWKLRRAGFDVLVVDRALFPRDKVCAGWITPQVVEDLDLDVDAYRRSHVFQPITAFRTGLIDETPFVDTRYARPVSYGIRRCEFDRYLLERSGARLRLGEPVSDLRFDEARAHWIVNGRFEAQMLVGAGGHFCPVARALNPSAEHRALVVAQEVEFPLEPADMDSWPTEPQEPELYFTRNLRGYGWCFRKGRYMNIGFGHLGGGALPKAVAEFIEFLHARRRIPEGVSWPWRGHAYLVSDPPCRQVVGSGVLLVGDAAGLAHPQSGEGIRAAVESGILAAAAIQAAEGEYTRPRLASYADQVRDRFGPSAAARVLAASPLPRLMLPLLPQLLRAPWIVKHILLDHAFLQAGMPPLRRVSAARPDIRH